MLRQRGAGVASVHPGPSAADSLLVSGEGQPVRWRRRLLGGLLLLGVFALARGPLIAVTHPQPVSNDDAIPLLIGRALLHGELSTTLWNQPSDRSLRFDDPAIGIEWPLDGIEPQLAAKDAAAPLLADAELFQ